MAIDHFWLNLRTAVSLISPTITTDWKDLDPVILERRIGTALMGLTPRSLEGFDPEDFTFLDQHQQAELGLAVERFRAIVGEVSRDQPVTPQQTEQALDSFETILRILQPHRFRDAESFQTQVRLGTKLQGRLPRWVTGLRCETGTDTAGDLALWIWVEVTDDATTKGRIEKEGQVIHDLIESAYRETGGRRWPFIRFRSPDAFARRQGGAA
jgi:hypothetical protein